MFFTRTRKTRPATRSPSRTFRPRLEVLEDLSVPSAGVLDRTFDTDGLTTTAFGSGTRDSARGIAIQSDGKAVAVGEANGQFGLARYTANGALDTTFGSGGKVLTRMGSIGLRVAAFDVAIYQNAGTANDGKIVVAGAAAVGGGGNTAFGVARYNRDGSLDKTFNKTGTVTIDFSASPDEARGVVLQPDGKIVVAGYSTVSGWDSAFTMIRFNVNGTLDKTFGSGGRVVTNVVANGEVQAVTESIQGLALQPDGKLVAAGKAPNSGNYSFALARYNANGTLDATFGSGGIVCNPTGTSLGDVANAILIQPDGRIIAAGNLDENWFTQGGVMRFNPNGTLDASFGSSGVAVVNFSAGSTDFNSVSGAALQPDGKIVIAGGATITGTGHIAALARLNEGGTLDAGFGTDGVVLTNTGSSNQHFSDVALQADGKIVAAGHVSNGSGNDVDFLVARYLSDSNLLAASTPILARSATITVAEAQPLLTEALRRWQASGANNSRLDTVNIRIADLGGTTLGLASGNTIYLDDNAAGWGWFLDPTPSDDAEFTTPGNQGEQNRMDLLSVLMHELGHVMGHDHDEGGVMAETLSAGTRLTLHGVDVQEAWWLAGLPDSTKKRDAFGWWL